VALGIDATGVSWGSMLVKIGAVFGLATVMLVMLLGQTRVFYSMSKDGLLWKWASAMHPKFRTPWITTIVFGIFAALFPAFLPIGRLADLVNIGTLLAFTIVCAGVWVLRVRHPEMHRPFKTPLVPLVPILGIGSAVYPHVAKLAAITWEVMIGWLIFGLIIYFTTRSAQQGAEAGQGASGGLSENFGAKATASRNGRPFWLRKMALTPGIW
jgi:basic amino acid/polyamine antiporter, APA family